MTSFLGGLRAEPQFPGIILDLFLVPGFDFQLPCEDDTVKEGTWQGDIPVGQASGQPYDLRIAKPAQDHCVLVIRELRAPLRVFPAKREIPYRLSTRVMHAKQDVVHSSLSQEIPRLSGNDQRGLTLFS